MAPPISTVLKHIESVPVEFDKSLLKLCGRPNTVKLLMWDTLKGKTLDHVMPKENTGCIFLMMRKGTESNVGHFVCAWRKHNKVWFFDPYAFDLKQRLTTLTNNADYLTPMVEKAGLKLDENHFRIQALKESVECCARHVCCRLQLLGFWQGYCHYC